MATTTPPQSPSAPPTYHTSLLTATDSRGHIHLILGSNPLAAARCTQSLASGATPILIAPEPPSDTPLHFGLQTHIDSGALAWLKRPFHPSDLLTQGRPAVARVVDAVFLTSPRHLAVPAADVAAACRAHRIPVNVVDAPALCSFTLLSTHVDGPLQIGVTTNGRGCKLASRIRREVAAALPAGLGAACARIGEARRRVLDEDCAGGGDLGAEVDGLEESVGQGAGFNKLVNVKAADADEEAKTRRIRWLSQVCEYWPLKKLAAITPADMAAVLSPTTSPAADLPKPPTLALNPNTQGRIILAGSGPGHPDLLTRASDRALQTADLILADKLVPAGVLSLIPRRTPVTIARKFPGNADAAQDELLTSALSAFRAGHTVLRLKQGDPFLYGRGGEEVTWFLHHGVPADRIAVLPGLTSALAAPLFARIPATQRGVADQVLVCTGTGRRGVPPAPPPCRAGQTVVFLMALHRVGGLVAELTTHAADEAAGEEGGRALWPRGTPCAVVERASCPDQRVVRTTLEHVVEAVEQEGSRPPGLLVVGGACEVLYTPAKGRSWVVEEGFKGLDLDDGVLQGMEGLA